MDVFFNKKYLTLRDFLLKKPTTSVLHKKRFILSTIMKLIKKIFYIADKVFAKIAVFLIKIYQWTISPSKWIFRFLYSQKTCIHEPHCSEYGRQCYNKYGFIKWTKYTMSRVSKCRPNNKIKYDPVSFRVVFFCSAPIGVNFLDKLSKDPRFDICWVVTAPDRPINRWQKVAPNIIKKTALKLGIEDIQTPTKINPDKTKEGKDFATWLESKGADFFVVIAYGKIIPQPILDIPNIAPINIHGSILPKYRGASPIQSVLLDWESKTGITIMKMDATMDTGDMIKIMKFAIDPDWTVIDIIEKMTLDGPDFFVETLWEFGKGEIKAIKQDDKKATYCSKFTKENGKIDWNQSAKTIYNKFRAFRIWPGTYTKFNGKKLLIEKCSVREFQWGTAIVDDRVIWFHNPSKNKKIGKVMKLWEDIVVLCGKWALNLQEVKLEGKKTQNIKDFVNGHQDFLNYTFR